MTPAARSPAARRENTPATTSGEPEESFSEEAWRARRFQEELAVRGGLALVVLVANELAGWLAGGMGANSLTRLVALSALLVNGPYYLAARTGRGLVGQAYLRIFVDIGFITAGLYGAGGLAAAPYLGVYTAVAVYAAIVFSASAGLAATGFGSACFLSVALAQQTGWLAMPALPPHAWGTACFNLLVLNIVAALTGLLAEAFRRNRRRVRETEARFQALAESAADAIVTADETGRLVSWNRAAERMFGYTAAEVAGQPFTILMPGRPGASGPAALEHEDIERMVGHTVEITARRKDGAEVLVELSLASWRTGSGQFLSAILRDVSTRKQVEAEFRQSQKMEVVGNLAGSVAHDFNNLLTAIMAYCQLMLREAEDPIRVRERLDRLMKTARRGTALTRQLLGFSRQQVLAPRVLALNAVVSDVDDLIRRLIGPNIEIVALLDPELGPVKADPGQIEQILINLAVNARDAMPRGGRLTIETANAEVDAGRARRIPEGRPGAFVLLAMSDTGIGMDAAVRGRIFEPFFTTKEPGKGTGLGLATVRGIVKQNGGLIDVQSEPGKGSTFQIYLPRIDEQAETMAEPGSAPRGLRGSETILVVEDEPDVLLGASDTLQAAGYTVLEAREPAQAMTLSATHTGVIHLAVVDVVMPQMSGHELVQRLARYRPEMKVLFVSGYTDNREVQEVAAAREFLQKPFTGDSLAPRIRQLLDKRQEVSGPR